MPAKAPEGRRERSRRQRHRRILDTAMRLIVEEGVEAMTMHRVARELDVAVGGLYRYFESKDALLAQLEHEVACFVRDRLGEVAAARPVGSASAALEHLAALTAAYREIARDAPERFHLLMFMTNDPRIMLPEPERGRVIAVMRQILAGIAESIARATALGALAPGDPTARTLSLWSALNGALQLGKLEKTEPDLICIDRIVSDTVRGLLVGWGGAPAAVDAALQAVGLASA